MVAPTTATTSAVIAIARPAASTATIARTVPTAIALPVAITIGVAAHVPARRRVVCPFRQREVDAYTPPVNFQIAARFLGFGCRFDRVEVHKPEAFGLAGLAIKH